MAQSDATKSAEEALTRAEEALRKVEGSFNVTRSNISVNDGVIHGRKVRIVSIISEKNVRDESTHK